MATMKENTIIFSLSLSSTLYIFNKACKNGIQLIKKFLFQQFLRIDPVS